MKEEKEFLKKKFIEFQTKISELSQSIHACKENNFNREKDFLLNIFEVIDAFDNLEETISAKEKDLDKTSLRIVKSIRSIYRKLKRILEDKKIVPLDFPDNKASMEKCIIVETEENSELENETIISIVKKGYINTEEKVILRKAEVITAVNDNENNFKNIEDEVG